MSNRFLPVLLLSALLGACATSTETATPAATPTAAASLTLTDQPSGAAVVISSFTLDKPGYVVIHKDGGGAPGPVIGVSEVIAPGTYTDYQVAIDASQAGTAVFPMLHYDNGNGAYEFPGPDVPVKVGDKVLVGKVTWR